MFRFACSKQGKGVRRRRGGSYHKREGWDEEIGVRSGREGNKFFLSGSLGYYLNATPAITKPKGKPLHV